MTTAEQFLRRIADVPDDDLVRGVFADYLDEHGHRESAAWHRAGGRMTGDVKPAGRCSPAPRRG